MNRRVLPIAGLALLIGSTPALSQDVGPGYYSAFPFKEVGDSGVIEYTDIIGGPYVVDTWVVSGEDPCVYWNVPADEANSQQQYNVPGCVGVATPWIRLKPWHSGGWAVYCPSSAPYNWGAGGPLSYPTQVVLGSKAVKFSSYGPAQRSGPKPVGKGDYYATNYSLTNSHHWRFAIGCSSEEFTRTGQGGKYSNGEGPSGSPFPRSASIANARAQASGPAAARRGPIARRSRIDYTTFDKTIEVDRRPNRTRTYRAVCPRGHRVVFARHGIGWFTGALPPRRGLAAKVDDRPKGVRRGFEVRVATGDIPARTARLQMHLGCTTSFIDPALFSPPNLVPPFLRSRSPEA